MNEQEVRALLSIIMAYDNRKPGDANVRAWQEAALRGGWTFETARQAVKQHFDTNQAFLMPVHVNAIVEAVRKDIRSRFTEDVCPPRELADDPRAEIEWRRQRVESYTQRALAAWASGQDIPELEQRQALGDKDRPQLASAVRVIASGWAIPREPRSAPPASRRTAVDRARLERARQELASIRPVESEGRPS